MMRTALLSIITALSGMATATAQQGPNPHIGYIYPAGGLRGTTFYVTIGGQFLQGASEIHLTGNGVHAKVIEHCPPLRAMGPDKRRALMQTMAELFRLRLEEAVRDEAIRRSPEYRQIMRELQRGKRRMKAEESDEPAELPRHPLLHELEHKSLRELLHVRHFLRQWREGQQNNQIAETVLVQVSIDRRAEPGERELRLATRAGLTNPMVFAVDVMPDVYELEIGDVQAPRLLPPEPPAELPAVFNGQIMPGDTDRFRFVAQQGQRLVIEAHARRLVPFLADAVPGWFQATISLYDSAGEEVAFVDDYEFSPDPVLCYDVPTNGEYELEIRDSIYRGREDFVYRVSVGERPFVTSVFPLGCQVGQRRYVTADGWNLVGERLFIDGRQVDVPGIRHKTLGSGQAVSNPVAYEVSAVRSEAEEEPNNTLSDAQLVRLPRIVDGRIESAGDIDYYQFRAAAGEVVVVEAVARRVYSPVDALVRLMDANGEVLAWNDDYEHKDGFLHTDMGVLTHHADSYLRAELPTKGTYYVQFTDAQSHGGAGYGYRLRISNPQPGFALRMTPASINVRAGLATLVHIHALRKDGFDGEIEVLLKDTPPGFELSGAWVPPGKDSVRATLTAPARRLEQPVTLAFEGRAVIDGKTVVRPVMPAEDMMQAFLYRHLRPVEEFKAAVLGGGGRGRSLRLVDEQRVRIPVGSLASVRLEAPRHPKLRELELELREPPAGIRLQDVELGFGEMSLKLTADRDDVQIGLADNLIVEAFLEVERGGQNGRPVEKRRVSVGLLPAIPFEVVAR